MRQVDVIVGCQYGSESKGLVASMVANQRKYDWFVSVNSSQAGHTAPYKTANGIKHVITRQLPSSCMSDMDTPIYIGPGAIINMEVLKEEILKLEGLGVPIQGRLYIHSNATCVTEEDIEFEKQNDLTGKIGSTCEGVGAAISRRSMRTAKVIRDVIDDFMEQTGMEIFTVESTEDVNGIILLEGSQGFGLSPFWSYPYCTSRDTTTAAFLSYAHFSPREVMDVYGVYRTFPIRVGGNSGWMYKEVTWDDVCNISGYSSLAEYTTVTKRLRRVGMWDPYLAMMSTRINGVNRPIITFVNYLNKDVEGSACVDELDDSTVATIARMSGDIGVDWFALSTAKEGGWIIKS